MPESYGNILMLKQAFCFILGLVLGACSPGALVVPQSHVDDAAALASKTIALVHDRNGQELRSFCSGVWVSDTSILTAFHCVDDVGADGVSYTAPETDKAFHAALYAIDPGHDLALLRSAGNYAPYHGVAHVGLDNIRPGAWVSTMGHPLGLTWSYSSGDIAAVRDLDIGDGLGEVSWIQATAPISPGNSGCGLFDAHGSLVGVAHAFMPRGESLAFFVHGKYVDAFLRKQGNAL